MVKNLFKTTMYINKHCLLLLFIFLFGWASPVQAQTLLAMAEENPPYCYTSKGRPMGVAVELFEKMTQQAQIDCPVESIRFWPWARGYEEVQVNRNAILFPMARTVEREALVQWIGPIQTLKASFIARKASKITFQSIDQVTEKYIVGTIRDSAAEQMLVSMGVAQNKIHSVHSINLNIRKLLKGRIDLLLVNEAAFFHSLESMGHNADEYEVVHPFLDTTLYFAANKDMDRDVVRRLQKALDSIKNSGQQTTILSKYSM